jgi:hypothetical protein
MNQLSCVSKYVVALLIATVTLMIYFSENFEQLKTTFIILIALETLFFFLIDYHYQDEMIEIWKRIDQLTETQVENMRT